MSNHLDWTGTLPDGWQVKPLRAVADSMVSNVDKLVSDDEIPVRLCNYTDVYYNEFIGPDLDLMHATASVQEIERFGLSVGDVLITKDSESWEDIGVPALVVETADDIVCGYHLALLRPRETVHGAFLFRCLQARPVQVQLELAANGVTRFGLPKSGIRDASIPVPPLRQQRAIADYLDRETARLDALVAAKQCLLGLLAEKRRAIVTRAVTRGLDPHAPMRESGVPGLGQIPAHWRTVRLRFLTTSIEQGWSPEAANRKPNPGEWGVTKLNAVNHGRFDETAVKTLPADLTPRTDLAVRAGDLLITRSNTPSLVGDACFVERTVPNLMLSDLIYRLALKTDMVDGRFLAQFLILEVARRQIESDARGASASMVKISQEHIKNWRVPLPPLREQQKIVETVFHSTGAVDKASAATEHTTSLLKERRAALIAAAVTGKLDVGSAS